MPKQKKQKSDAYNGYNGYMHGFLSAIIEKVGPREAGSDQERAAGDLIEQEMKKYCDETRQEPFECNPTAFLGFIRYGALLMALAIILYWFGLAIDVGWLSWPANLSLISSVAALFISAFSVTYFIAEVMRYKELVEPLFPKKTCRNVVGIINPVGEVKKTIIFSGHHDSAYEFNLFYYLKTFGAVTIFIGYAGIIIFLITSLIRVATQLAGIAALNVFYALGWFFIALLPITVIYVFFHSYRPVQGAFDNLSSVAVALGIGKYLAEHSNEKPKHTRIMLVSFAAEEAGVRGSKRFVEQHKKELDVKNTTIINMDGLAEKDNVLIVRNEPLIGATHDAALNNSLIKIAAEKGVPTNIASLPFGATDAAPFSLGGYSATSIFAYEHKLKLPAYYHTRLDTPEVVDEEVLGQVLQIGLGYLKKVDS